MHGPTTTTRAPGTLDHNNPPGTPPLAKHLALYSAMIVSVRGREPGHLVKQGAAAGLRGSLAAAAPGNRQPRRLVKAHGRTHEQHPSRPSSPHTRAPGGA